MRNILLSILVVLLTFCFVADVNAKRFGGGASFGMKRNVSNFSRYNGNPAPMQAIGKTASPASGMSKWLGPIAGLAMGGMLASLFMGHGVGTGILSWLVIIGGALFLWRLLSSRLQPAVRPVQRDNYQAQSFQNFSQPFSTPQQGAAFDNAPSQVMPDGFDEAAFLRQAKASFIRLQAAYDNKNLADIREFTTPEVFAEIQLQLQERGAEENHTEVMNINSELLDVSNESNTMIASTLFSGSVREQKGAEPVAIKEIWHFRKDIYSQNWAVAGIQQA